jgi:hypothetical protein
VLRPDPPRIQLAQCRCIAFLAIQKAIHPRVGAGLAADDPADAAGAHEAVIHDRRHRLGVFDEGGRVFAPGFVVPGTSGQVLQERITP